MPLYSPVTHIHVFCSVSVLSKKIYHIENKFKSEKQEVGFITPWVPFAERRNISMEKEIDFIEEQPQFDILIDNKRWRIEWQEHYEKSLLLFITGKCNLKCENCFSISTRNITELSIKDISRILDSNPDYVKVDLMGGEPFLHSDIAGVIETVRQKDRKITIYTNGTLLNTYPKKLMPVRVCISFHDIVSDDPSRKPLANIIDDLNTFAIWGNQIKLVLLLDKWNYKNVLEEINYVEKYCGFLNTLTIGLMRFENDYWNDNYPGVLSFKDYAICIQNVIDNYNGRLNLNIFQKGVLSFGGDPEYIEQRTNRFKCIFQDLTYSDCLYNACDFIRSTLGDKYKLPKERSYCKHTGKKVCLADKVRLKNCMGLNHDGGSVLG